MGRFVLAALVAALFIAAPSHAQTTRDGVTAKSLEGISNAREDGIYVDPAVEPLMARAPVGSCANDPTRPKCPPATAVMLSGDGTYGPLATPPTQPVGLAAKRVRARAAQIPACRVRVNATSPYKYQGMAQMDGQNYCEAPVTHHELYGALYKWYNNVRHLMNSRLNASGVPGSTINIKVRYDCTSVSVWRTWEAEAVGYSWAYGTIWAGFNFRRDPMYCG